MLNLINRIGQRKLSKIFFIVSFLVSILCFFLTAGMHSLLKPLTWLGVALMCAPIGFLSLAAHKTKPYRLACIALQVALLSINTVIYFLNIPQFYFILTLVETLLSVVVLVVISQMKPPPMPLKKRKSTPLTPTAAPSEVTRGAPDEK